MREQVLDAFKVYLEEIGLLSRFDVLLELADELLRWNKTHNLTAYTTHADIISYLFMDSLFLARFCNQGSCLDIGSGAGFPGLMLALARPDVQVTMLDARRKRVTFQKHAIRCLGLQNIKALWGRAGEKDVISNKFDTVTCKALASLPAAFAICQQYVKDGGMILLPRGIGDEQACRDLCNNSTKQWQFELSRYSIAGNKGEMLLLRACSSKGYAIG